jgi:hypothetical protein
MPEYLAILIAPDGQYKSAIKLQEPNDEFAIEAAKVLVDGHDVEVWLDDRRVTILLCFTKKKRSKAASVGVLWCWPVLRLSGLI